ncbi:MAG: hypothetical protein ACYCX9_03655 [Candidatus Dormibacteria bacterium]|jgi:organic hydroperoxide reductase OsmC/OhrA
MLTQLAKLSPKHEVEILEAEADVRAEFSLADKYGLGGPPGAFQMVDVRLNVTSPSDPAAVAELCRDAERSCHATQTFRLPVPTALRVDLNGQDLELHAQGG